MTLMPTAPVHAQLDSCTTGVSPNSAARGSDTSFGFGIFNSNDNPIAWLQVTRPSGSYVTLESASASGWQGDITSPDTATFTLGNLPKNYSQSFGVQAMTQNADGGPVNWTVQVSDDPSGTNPITCDGDTSLMIATQPSVINISNVRVTEVGVDRVRVLWDTDVVSTSKVDYGLDTDYGQSTSTDTALVTSHSVLVTGLTASTGYHFMVTSTTPADGGTVVSGDNTFLTADVAAISAGGGVPGAKVPTGGTSVGGGQVTTPTGVPTESTPPTIAITTQLAGTYKAPPTIVGHAEDNDKIAKIEYSIDGGKNWLPADSVVQGATTTGTGKKKKTVANAGSVTFSFTPVIVDEGNFVVLARATDPSGNQATTDGIVLVIDRLPPRFGTSVVTIGPQMIEPVTDGTLELPAGIDYKVSVSLVGGPVTVGIRAQIGAESGKIFSLTKSGEANLWTGILSFETAGRYRLTGEATDGAGNSAKRLLATVVVVPPVQVSGNARDLKSVRATVYNLSPETHSWSVWDGSPYGQHNPQSLDDKNKFSLLLPAGEYYLKLAVRGSPDTITRSFKVDRPTPLTGPMALSKPFGLRLGPLSLVWPWSSLVAPPVGKGTSGTKSINTPVGSRLPLVGLATTAGNQVSPVDWYGKPTVLVSIATWAPSTAEQLSALSNLSGNSDVNVVLVAGQQRAETVEAYLQVAGSKLEVACDPDGLLSDTLTIPGTPALYFIDRHGIIKKVMVGTRSADDILTELGHL